jgi:signal peptidase II
MGVLLGLAAVIVTADQLTKAWAVARLGAAPPLVVVPGLVQLVLVMNPGVAFGILGGVPDRWRWLVTVVSLGALLVLCSLGTRIVPQGGWLGRGALGLVLGGALGNLVDRWRLGAVVDFVDVHWRDWHWPAFNVADAAITVGVTLLAAELLLSSGDGRRASPGSPRAASPDPGA